MKHQWKFFSTIIIGIIAGVCELVFHQKLWAEVIIDIAGAIMALSMLWEMIQTLKQGKWGVDLLAIIAVVSTMLVRQYWAALMILFMLTGGDSLEDYAASQAGKELQSLLDHSPRIAHKLVNGVVSDVKVEDLRVNDTIVIKPGNQVPVDGVISKGSSSFDQSSLTGESVPVDKTVGDELMSGSINGDVAVEMTVTKEAKDSEYQRIVELVKSSQAQPAKFVKMADRYAVPFTIISLVIGIAAWIISGDPVRFVEVMAVASPCPLLLAAPVAWVSGMSSMSRHNIIVKSGTTLEKLARVKTFAFDKTGTLTENQLVIDQIVTVDQTYGQDELKKLAASAEQQSSHIIASSLVKAVPKSDLLPANDVKETTGQGLTAIVDGKAIKVGKRSFVTDEDDAKKVNTTAIYVAIDGEYAGYITFKDQMRPETAETLATLRRQGVDHIMMLTGDHEDVAKKIGDAAGVDDIRHDLLPAQKIEAIKQVPKEQRPVVMVGDGVNDAPSLTAADVGIAMGAKGATAASESADAIIMVNDLSRVNNAVAISKHTQKVANIDVLTAITIVIIIELIAFTGVIPVLFGAILQEVVDVITILLALLAKTEPKNPAQTGVEQAKA
ncbi:MAG: cadmium-translocating P-type ATPase [Lactobacillus sp.]|jgi:heavy metal translocating P-type ATPase|nr:cadmium-translocating P-type ATPase [Lactobacillus sp.]MCI1481205.1 cadmium-translocating P-type ATPase [Lactobacillus sp.]MCI1884046.1 cadmium-translocating P-type ATPase [Lactobacillus sp.]MCI1915958.1 cadmium-translocating P-type ATPase [Lactobacillus sp.]